jgi:hypothetical protein
VSTRANFTDSVLRNIGTIKASSGTRLGATLTGIDTPTLRDVWQTAPYLHDGSAATVEAAIQAHNSFTLNSTDLANVASYVKQIGRDEAGATVPGTPTTGVKYVRLVALSEVNGNPFTTIAEFNLFDTAGNTLTRTAWTVSADSYEPDSPPINAIDGQTTIWHTQWRTATPPTPHTFTAALGAAANLGGFRYLPRQDANIGQIATYNFYTSTDNVTGNWYYRA